MWVFFFVVVCLFLVLVYFCCCYRGTKGRTMNWDGEACFIYSINTEKLQKKEDRIQYLETCVGHCN